MKIITVSFDYRNDWYSRLVRAFKNSINLYMPDVGLTEYRYDFNETLNNSNRSAPYIYNTFKLDRWVDILKNTNENLALVDCDMIMTNRIDDVWENDFDIAYTYRRKWSLTKKGIPYNGGVIFVRPNERSIRFFERLSTINKMMLDDQVFHRTWSKKYAGINQSAFGYMMERESNFCKMHPLPCPVWNSVDESWGNFNSETKMVHIKSKLRKYCLGVLKPVPAKYSFLTDMWKWFELLDENKNHILENLDFLPKTEYISDSHKIPLTIIAPKINDPHTIKKIKDFLLIDDEFFHFKNIKQNYQKIVKKANNENILFINPANYKLLNNPVLIDDFRDNSDLMLVNNKERPDKGSFKVKKSVIYDKMDTGIKSFRYISKVIYNMYDKKSSPKKNKADDLNFEWERYIPKDLLKQYCLKKEYNSTIINDFF